MLELRRFATTAGHDGTRFKRNVRCSFRLKAQVFLRAPFLDVPMNNILKSEAC